MASATALQISLREPDAHPLLLERRLFVAYVAAYTATFLVAALFVRWAFIANLERETESRLQILARAGLRSTISRGDRVEVDKREISNTALVQRGQGLQWYDDGGRLLASEGVTPNKPPLIEGSGTVQSGKRVFTTFGVPILSVTTHQHAGTVVASEWSDDRETDVRSLDAGLVAGTVLSVLVSALAAMALARSATRPVVRSFATLRDFTADASHELRGPLTGIAGNADAALRDLQRDPERDRSRFEAIADGARQMSRLTSDLLLLAGAGRSLERDLFVVDLRVIVNDVVRAYQERFTHAGIRLDSHVGDGAIAYGNPVQIGRVLANLVENALRYTPSGGAVSIDAARDRAHVLLTVRDTGIGIAPEHLKRIFDRFWRADQARSAGGSGLGLAIARALARRHGGDVTVTSRPGAGSSFVASFPTRPTHVR